MFKFPASASLFAVDTLEWSRQQPDCSVDLVVRSFCPPGGIVYDPFCGSGTTGAVALRHGRRFIGTDVRESQIKLTRRRLAESFGANT